MKERPQPWLQSFFGVVLSGVFSCASALIPCIHAVGAKHCWRRDQRLQELPCHAGEGWTTPLKMKCFSSLWHGVQSSSTAWSWLGGCSQAAARHAHLSRRQCQTRRCVLASRRTSTGSSNVDAIQAAGTFWVQHTELCAVGHSTHNGSEVQKRRPQGDTAKQCFVWRRLMLSFVPLQSRLPVQVGPPGTTTFVATPCRNPLVLESWAVQSWAVSR